MKEREKRETGHLCNAEYHAVKVLSEVDGIAGLDDNDLFAQIKAMAKFGKTVCNGFETALYLRCNGVLCP